MSHSNHPFDYDLLVIGSGPAGQRAAIQGAKLDKSVALIEKKTVLGGVSINTGTIPSKTLREAVMELSGYRGKEFYGLSYSVKERITMQDLLQRVDSVIRHEIDVTRAQLLRNRVEVLSAAASFVDAHTLRLDYSEGGGHRQVRAQEIIIATGTEATKDLIAFIDTATGLPCTPNGGNINVVWDSGANRIFKL